MHLNTGIYRISKEISSITITNPVLNWGQSSVSINVSDSQPVWGSSVYPGPGFYPKFYSTTNKSLITSTKMTTGQFRAINKYTQTKRITLFVNKIK